MKATRLLWVLLIAVVALAACMAGKPNELIGNWQKEDGSRIEFLKDGKVNFTGGPVTISTSFKIEQRGSLSVDLGIFGTASFKYAVAQDSLTLTNAQGKDSKYAKVKEAKTNEQAKEQPHPEKP